MAAPAPAPARAQAGLTLEELGASTARALSGQPALHLRTRRFWRGAQPLPCFGPHLQPSADGVDDLPALRAIGDGTAARLRASSEALHRQLAPADAGERWLFEVLEQLRTEALMPDTLPGVAANLRARFEHWSHGFHDSGLCESENGLLLYTVIQVCRSRLTGEPVVAATEDLIEATRAALVPTLGAHLAALRRHRFDQAAFAMPAREVARLVAASLTQPQAGQASAPRRGAPFTLWFDYEGLPQDALPLAGGGQADDETAAPVRYRAFTTAYDTERAAATLVRRALLEEYRQRLDDQAAQLGLGIGRLVRELQAVLAQPEADGWDDGQEQGLLDGRRLSQLVASPAERRLFRTARHVPRTDCAVAFLIDCSASMRDRIEPLALFVDTCARALDAAGASCEVLGFTTGAWSGGRAWKDWQRAGRPPHPGRLNERCHLVFKDAATPWARGRRGIAALLKADLFREGCDGEAVDWACERLLAQDVARRVLFVVSDGSPMDAATALANDAGYLDRHLLDVVVRREQEARVEITGIGIGLDLSPYYRHTMTLELSRGLERESFQALVRRLRPGRRR